MAKPLGSTFVRPNLRGMGSLWHFFGLFLERISHFLGYIKNSWTTLLRMTTHEFPKESCNRALTLTIIKGEVSLFVTLGLVI